MQVFYNSIAAAVNELDNITLSVADVVVGSKAGAVVCGIVYRNDIPARGTKENRPRGPTSFPRFFSLPLPLVPKGFFLVRLALMIIS